MATYSNEKKTTQLGVPFGTAYSALRKKIMFTLVQRLGEDYCFHCTEQIENLEQFTIEHKQPWLDVDPALFWDMENIAFSHFRCNVANARRHTSDKIKSYQKLKETNSIKTSDGHAWCCACKQEKPLDQFHKNRFKRLGIQTECKTCVKLNRYGK